MSPSEYGMNFIGMKYIWGGEGPHQEGFDCSGLVLECLRASGDWGKQDSTAVGIFHTLLNKWEFLDPSTPSIDKDSLLFFGPSRTQINHVAFSIGNGFMLEAGGGDSKSNSGMVRIRPIGWRKDLVAILRKRK